jgi:2-dehydro-3-deoxyphosphogluconate aldolase/(4S)-4-hydroxy-2-oxoglutarate aldolase
MPEPTWAEHPVRLRFAKERLIGIVRTNNAESAIWASEQLIEAGIRLIEIPFTVPNTPTVIESLAERFPDAIIGAGTVLERSDAVKAMAAGAQFLVSPVLIPAMVQFGIENNVFVLPGCMTPTEIWDAYQLGAPVIKFFPAQAAGGPEFLKAVLAPFPQVSIVPTGGILQEHVSAYLQAGALAVGVGNPLLPKEFLLRRDASELRAHASQFLQAALG